MPLRCGSRSGESFGHKRWSVEQYPFEVLVLRWGPRQIGLACGFSFCECSVDRFRLAIEFIDPSSVDGPRALGPCHRPTAKREGASHPLPRIASTSELSAPCLATRSARCRSNLRCHPEALISCQGDGGRGRLSRPQAIVVETVHEPCALPRATRYSTAPRFCSPVHIRSVCTPDQR
jgi:hypothetical protein